MFSAGVDVKSAILDEHGRYFMNRADDSASPLRSNDSMVSFQTPLLENESGG